MLFDARGPKMFEPAGMLLTLVRHACASRQNKFAVHVLQQDRSLACHVREDSLDALGERKEKKWMMPEKSTQAGLLSACFNLSLTKASTAGKSRQIPRQVLNLACGLSWRSRPQHDSP